jgi:hypothetical protein
MTAALTTPQLTLTDDELQVAAARVGIQGLPVVLNLRSKYGTAEAHSAAIDRATHDLVGRGLILDGAVAPELVGQMQVLQRPDRELAMRMVTPDGSVRLTVVRQGRQLVWARRVGNDISIGTGDGGPSLGEAGRVILATLPAGAAADVTPVGAPLEQAAQALSFTHDPAQLADRIRALGADQRAAMLLGSALSTRQAFAEIVYYTLGSEDGRVSRQPGAVGVFYTKRGRLVGAPSSSPSGQLWATLKGGSDHAIKQALGQLVELSSDRWEEL